MNDQTIVRVRDVMKTGFDIVDGRMTITDALSAMKYHDNKSLIVNRRDKDDEYGILLISDLAKQVLAKNRSPERVNVYEVMAKPVIVVDADMQIKYCARMFDQFGLARAPVFDKGELVGLVSYTDMVLKGLMPDDA